MQVEKKWILKENAEPETVRQLSSELGVDPVLAELLVQRGVTTFQQARSFFRPDLADLHDPFLMKGMEEAVSRVHDAVISREKILVYGDYDVDGTTAVSLVCLRYGRNFCRMCNVTQSEQKATAVHRAYGYSSCFHINHTDSRFVSDDRCDDFTWCISRNHDHI